MNSLTEYWTKEKCQEVALLCKTRTEFFKKYTDAYYVSRKSKWLDEVCSHMKRKKNKPAGYWTKIRCHKAALKCESRTEFKEKYPGAYGASKAKFGWLDELCSHMKKKPQLGNKTKKKWFGYVPKSH